MTDINKMVAEPDFYQEDLMGYLAELEPWTHEFAEERAKEEGVTLTDEHWDVIHFLRNHYRENGPMTSGPRLLRMMEERYSAQGGGKYLFGLFPRGPVNQASTIAGLPLPAYSRERSFGSVE